MIKKNQKATNSYITTSSEWTFEILELFDQEIAKIAAEYKLDTYPNQIEIITAEQMMDAYSSVGMPLNYPHWSFGKQFLNVEKNYKRGFMGLAFEIVINSNPCIAYLMEENTTAMQALVIAHASYGHNSFFKNNYLFRSWTNADSIVDYLVFAKNYIHKCEERYGQNEVEEVLDACHALMNYGVDRYRRPNKLSVEEEKQRQSKREEYIQSQINTLWRTIPKKDSKSDKPIIFPSEPEENILYFVEKNAPLLEPWQREIIRIVRKMSQYFYPQKQTKVMNEGWATFWHYTIYNEMYNRKLINDAFMLEFLHNHTSVIYQPEFHSKYYSGINPYTLGFAIFQDIKRICEDPTSEDQQWFPNLAGKDWLSELDFAMRNFKDESFIAQYLSPKVIRDLRLFSILDDENNQHYEVDAIHNKQGYQAVREKMSRQFNLSYQEPNIQVYRVDTKGDRSLTLRYFQNNNRPLNKESQEVVKHLRQLWGFDVKLETIDQSGKKLSTYTCTTKDP